MPHGVSRGVSRMCVGGGDLGRALLELHRIGAGIRRDVDELLGEFDVAVVVQADLGDDVGGATASDDARSDRDGHELCPSRGRIGLVVRRGRRDAASAARSTRSASSLTAPCAAGPAHDDACGREHQRMRLRNGDGPADDLETREIVDVVAEVGDAGERDALLRPTHSRSAAALSSTALPHVDPELARPSADDGVRLGRQDQHRDAGARAAARSPIPSDLLTRTLSRPSASVSTVSSVWTPSKSVTTAATSIELGVRARQRGDRLGDRELLLGVDLDRGALGDLDQAHPAEEPVARGAEAGGIHHVERAGLEVVRLAVLATRPNARVVVDARARCRPASAPQEPVRLDCGEDAVVLVRPTRGRWRRRASRGSMNGEVACRKTRMLDVDSRSLRARRGRAGGRLSLARRVIGERRRVVRSPALPTPRAIAAISWSSVETTTRSMDAVRRAAAIARATSGTPPTRRTFLRGTPFEPPRAGITATISVMSGLDRQLLPSVSAARAAAADHAAGAAEHQRERGRRRRGRVRISRRLGGARPGPVPPEGPASRRATPGIDGDRRDLRRRLAPMRQVGDRGGWRLHLTQSRYSAIGIRPSTGRALPSSTRPAVAVVKGRAVRRVHSKRWRSTRTPSSRERCGTSLTEIESGEEVDLPGQGPAEDLFERERHDARGQPPLVHAGSRVRSAADERVREGDRVCSVVEERDAPRTQHGCGQPELSGEPVADEPVSVPREELPRDAEVRLARTEHRSAIDELIGGLGHLRREPAGERHPDAVRGCPLGRPDRAGAATPPRR